MMGAMPGVRQPFSSADSERTAGLFIQEQHYGLWMECGQEECTQFGFVLAAIPSGLQAARAMTVSSCILCGLSLLLLISGADFTTCVQNKDSKTKRIQAAGVGLMLAGLLVIIPVSLWAHNILRNKQCLSRDIGASIYIGWAAGVLMILTQGLLLSFGRPRSTRSAGGSSSRTVSSGGGTTTSIALVAWTLNTQSV